MGVGDPWWVMDACVLVEQAWQVLRSVRHTLTISNEASAVSVGTRPRIPLELECICPAIAVAVLCAEWPFWPGMQSSTTKRMAYVCT